MIRLQYLFLVVYLSILTVSSAQDAEAPFAADIRQFKVNDSINPPPEHAILFVGSSSFTFWKDLQDYFPGYKIVNRGFGGSTLPDLIRYAEDVIIAYKPQQIVIYCGENDLAASDTVTAEMVVERFRTLFSMIRVALPKVEITYVSMKPSPSRWHLADNMKAGNEGIRKFLKSQKNTGFVNVWDSMLNKQGRPDGSLFLPDSLHMNANGYRIWQTSIKPELINQ